SPSLISFFVNPPPTSYIHSLSLHDALPILSSIVAAGVAPSLWRGTSRQWRETNCEVVPFYPKLFLSIRAEIHRQDDAGAAGSARSEEHTSELQSRGHLVCRLLLEKKKKKTR